jgi:tRNA-dihydrouridine synthase
LRQELGIPVAGNGDIADAEDLLRRAGGLTTKSGLCDAVMVGRAAVRQPWIFAQAMEIGAGDRGSGNGDCCSKSGLESNKQRFGASTPVPNPRSPAPIYLVENTGLRFLELLSRYQPPEFHLSRAKRFFAFFCDNLKWGNYLKNLLNREESLGGIERAWRGYFSAHGDAL